MKHPLQELLETHEAEYPGMGVTVYMDHGLNGTNCLCVLIPHNGLGELVSLLMRFGRGMETLTQMEALVEGVETMKVEVRKGRDLVYWPGILYHY